MFQLSLPFCALILFSINLQIDKDFIGTTCTEASFTNNQETQNTTKIPSPVFIKGDSSIFHLAQLVM